MGNPFIAPHQYQYSQNKEKSAMLWVQRFLVQSSRLSASKLSLRPPSVCERCMQCQFSQHGCAQPALNHIYGPSSPYSFLKRMLATTGGTGIEEGMPPTSSPVGADPAATTTKGGSPRQAETVVKVQLTGKSKPVRKKTDFSKDYSDNIYIECDRARYEYLLTDEQLSQLPVIQRRSPYPGSDNITVYHRKHIMNKVIEVWGSMENLHREKRQRQQWESLDSHIFSLRMAQQRYQTQHTGTAEEKPFIFKPFEKSNAQPQKDSIFKTGPGKVVLWSFTVNATNVLMKFVAWLYTGSHSMFSEFIHSLADTVNQMILAVGVHQSLKKPDLEHPYGWANFRNVASLISGVGIFCLGAGFSIYHGVNGLLHPHTMDSLYWGIAILGGSFISEGGTLVVAINEVRNSAKRENISFMNYVWLGRDPSTNVVLLEDAAAVLGVSIAATCMSITYYTGNPLADAIGSIVIGSLLGGVASFIIYTNTIALVGRSIPIDQKAKLMAELENDRMIRAVHDVKATDMGGNSVRFKAEIDFDGKEVTRYYLEKSDMDLLLNEVQSMRTSEELEGFMLNHGENIVDTLGGEVDRIEKTLKKRHPEVRHVDLEQL